MNHSTHCTGCPTCDPEMRAVLSAFSSGDYETYCTWLTKQDAKHKLRTTIQEKTAMTKDYTPPDPYEKSLNDLRARDAKVAAARTYQPTPRSTTQVLDASGVPDPYAAALEQMRKENR